VEKRDLSKTTKGEKKSEKGKKKRRKKKKKNSLKLKKGGFFFFIFFLANAKESIIFLLSVAFSFYKVFDGFELR